MHLFGGSSKDSFVVLILIILVYLLYFFSPLLLKRFESQGGLLLLTQPISISSSTNLASYDDLKKNSSPGLITGTFDYHYGISCWIFLDVNEPNDMFKTILNFGGVPHIKYNPAKNLFEITVEQNNTMEMIMQRKKRKISHSGSHSGSGSTFGSPSSLEVYHTNDFLMQKWNHVIVNYNSGIMDVFINGSLVVSKDGIVPFMKYNDLIVGDKDGLQGGICNVTFFAEPCTTKQIYYLYEFVKDKTPPVYDPSSNAYESTKMLFSKVTNGV
jgi:hypothetical protein